MNTVATPLKIHTAAVSFRRGGFQTHLPNGREAVPNSTPSRGLHEAIVITGFEAVKSQ